MSFNKMLYIYIWFQIYIYLFLNKRWIVHDNLLSNLKLYPYSTTQKDDGNKVKQHEFQNVTWYHIKEKIHKLLSVEIWKIYTIKKRDNKFK